MTWVLSAFADEAGGSADDQVRALQRAGIKHVDLRGIEGFNITKLPVETAEQVRKTLDAGGIKVNMFGSPIGKIDIADDFQADLDKLTHLGRLSNVLGCKAVRIFSYYNKKSQPAAAWQSECLSRLGRLRDLAEQLGLVLYHENERHIFGERLEQVQLLGDKLRGKGNGAFRLIFDFDNYNQAGDDVWANWQALRNRTDAFHLKDSDQDNQHVPVGQGNGKVREVLGDAVQQGWHGPLSLEPHLQHSKAVMATIVSGKSNQAFAQMSPQDCFHAAAEAAKNILSEIKAPVS